MVSHSCKQNRAVEHGLLSVSMRNYVSGHQVQYPELMDLMAADERVVQEQQNSSVVGGVLAQASSFFPSHIAMSDILQGLKSKKYLKGTIRCKRDNIDECYVVVHTAEGEPRRSVTIRGLQNINRAVDEDVVAVELLHPAEVVAQDAQWEKARGTEDDTSIAPTSGGANVAGETAPASVEQEEGVFADAETVGATAMLLGRVVGIVKRNWRQYAGSIDPDTLLVTGSNNGGIGVQTDGDRATSDATDVSTSSAASLTVQFVPVDSRIPRVWISTRRAAELVGARLLVAIDCWPSTSRLPLGHYVGVLGHAGEKDLETKVLLHEFGVSHESFSPSVMACLPPADWRITEDLVRQRTDLRHIPVVSIDPPGCKDIDDALHCVRLPNGRLEAGVHIADVSHFVHPDTPLDKEASLRSTSTYLVERRLDMLPGYLTTELCSLRSKEDHLAFSVLWEMDDEGNIYDVKFCKSVIHSVRAGIVC